MDRLLTTRELAELLQLPLQTIYRWRVEGSGPPGYRVGRHIRYDPSDVVAWLHEHRSGTPASEVPGP
jgi:excisionase family DNA binding protein